MTCFLPMQGLLEGVGPEGAVYASMGTLCNFGPEEFVAIGQALSALPNLVIWKLAPGDLPGNATVDSLNLSSNIKARPCLALAMQTLHVMIAELFACTLVKHCAPNVAVLHTLLRLRHSTLHLVCRWSSGRLRMTC